MADWYYAKNGQHQGPVTSAQLKQMATSGQIGPDDLVFKDGSTQWVAASTVAGLFPAGGVASAPAPARAPTPAPAPAPARGGRSSRDDDGELPGGDDDGRVRPRMPKGSYIGDLLLFRQFATPWVIIILFWVGILYILYYGGGIFYRGVQIFIQFPAMETFIGLVIVGVGIPLAMLYWRVLCEVITVMFRIYETMQESVRQLQRLNDK